MLGRLILLLGLLGSGFFFSAAVHAECGGQQQCIAVSIDPAIAPAHGTPLVSAPIDFGNQSAATASAARTILVAAVEGPAGTRATLDSITLSGPNAADFRISGGTCTVGTPTLLHDGNVTALISNACTILVTFNPATAGVKNAQIDVSTTAITRTAPLSGTGTPSLTGPTAAATALAVPVNTPTALDLAPFITGTVTGVAVVTAPAHGTTTVSGTTVTYTPTHDYFGPDTLSYAAFNSVGSSSPATVTVSVSGRPDPTTNAAVIGLLRAQSQTARRFSRAQISNYQGRMEILHRGAASDTAASAGFASGRGIGAAPVPAQLPTSSFSIDRAGGVADTTLGGAFDDRTKIASASGPLGLGGLLPSSFASTLLSAATTRSLNLSASGAAPGGSPATAGATDVWIAGNVNFGRRDQTSDSSSLRFSTDGVSVGIDRRFSDNLALGFGLGYARDATAIGTDGSQSRARGSSIAVYGSYQPGASTFVDGLIGYGALSHDSERYVAAVNDFARGQRKSDQWFGSLAAGYEYRRDGLLLSPYGRLDFARDRLKQYTETGAGLNALTYFEQTLPTLQFSLGLRAESAHETDFGWALPRLRVEFKHDLRGERQATLAYADLVAGPIYSVTPSGDKRSSLLLGLGSDFILRGGLKLGVDYQIQRLSGVDHNQTIRLWLAKDLDGKGFSPGLLSTKLFHDPVRVEAGFTWDDNVNRANSGQDRLSDRIYSVSVGKNAVFPLGEHTRVVVAGFLSGDKFSQYHGLDRFSGGGQGEFQYRSSSEFDAATFGAFGRLTLDEYAGQLRSGHRFSLGVTVRQSLTDRIDAFGALARNLRHAENAVFDARDYSARFNLDYSLGRSGALYLGGEYRRGDVVSSMPPPVGYAPPAKVTVVDDAFGNGQFIAYRLEARTVLWTLGYNLPLGARDSLDFSGRHVQSTPTASGANGGSPRYTANQYSLAYLMRF
jgi:uncharacterized protein YhjY with autotransporter beta-barrel domain